MSATRSAPAWQRAPLVIAGRVFPTRADLITQVRGILHRTTPGAALEPADFQLMLALLCRHPRADEKIGGGLRAIRVEPDPVWGCTMFVAERLDGSSTDFSYLKCVRPPTARGDVLAACRHAVADDIIAFKREYFRNHGDIAGQVVCPLTGQLLGWLDAHVDHGPPWPFRRIIDAFFASADVRIDDVVVGVGGDGQVLHRLADSRLSEQFRQFHAHTAVLRVIAAAENLRIG